MFIQILPSFSENIKGQGHRTSKTSTTIWRHVYLEAADEAPAAQAPTAN